MATAVRTLTHDMLDFESGSCEILPLIPFLRESALVIEPPDGYKFGLKVGNQWFVKFHSMLPGPKLSGSIEHAAKLDNLIIVASYAVFVSHDLPVLKEKLFVGLIPLERKHKK